MSEQYMRTYAEIDLAAVRHNIMEARRKLDREGFMKTKVLAVVKANAYGHGVLEVVETLQGIADFYAVATYDEALEIRAAGFDSPVMILGYVAPAQYEALIRAGVSVTIYNPEDAKALSEAARAVGMTAKMHIALDTGMTRIGFLADVSKNLDAVITAATLPGIEFEGLFTHFSCADMTDKAYAKLQWERYDAFADALKAEGVTPKIFHICNSAGIMEFDHHRYDMVRSGITTYGLYPSDEVDMNALELHPVMSWRAHVVNVMDVEPGVGISYGATYVTKEPRKIATISIGYADGYPRGLSNKGYVLIHGQKAPITGRVCMDQMMVDVTDIKDAQGNPVQIQDLVTLVGRDGDACITMEEISTLAGSFNYEFACNVNLKRVPRIYLNRV